MATRYKSARELPIHHSPGDAGGVGGDGSEAYTRFALSLGPLEALPSQQFLPLWSGFKSSVQIQALQALFALQAAQHAE